MSDFNVPVSMIPPGEYLDSSDDDDEYEVEDINISSSAGSVRTREQTNAEHAREEGGTLGDNVLECDDHCDDDRCQQECGGQAEERTVEGAVTRQDDESEENSCADDMALEGAHSDEADSEQGCHDAFDAENESENDEMQLEETDEKIRVEVSDPATKRESDLEVTLNESESDLNLLGIRALKQMCTERGIAATGKKKSELIQLLRS